jgi:hypothetical protein
LLSKVLALLLLLGAVATGAFAQPVFTGDAVADFAGVPDVMVVPDPGGTTDVAVPAGVLDSGWDLKDLYFVYDPTTDIAYFGVDCDLTICGDADADGDPGGTSAGLTGNFGIDRPDYSITEFLAITLDTNGDYSPGTGAGFDAVFGVCSDGTGIALCSSVPGFGGYSFSGVVGSGFVTGISSFWLGALPNPVSLFASPSGAAPDIEFTIAAFSTLPGFSFTPGEGFEFGLNVAHGSLDDAGIGEDFMPGSGTVSTISVRIGAAPVATPPSAPTVTENAVNVALADDIQVADADAGDTQTATFTVTGGTVTLGTTGITFGGGGNAAASFTASGTLSALNTALDAATFTPIANLFGTNVATIAFKTNDGLVDSNTASVTFSIAAASDYGDAPEIANTGFAADYPVDEGAGGARHAVLTTVAHRLGASVDIDPDGQANADASGDDGDGSDDEDGVVFNTPFLVAAASDGIASVQITTYGDGYLSAWIDFDQDGAWGNEATATGEEVISNLSTGTAATSVVTVHQITLGMGATAGTSYMRVRFCSTSADCDTPIGASLDGEVEDYEVTLIDEDVAYTLAIDLDDITFDTIIVVGANTCFVDGGTNVLCVPTTPMTNVVVDGTAGNDTLTIDYSAGDPLPNGATFNAGGQSGTPGDSMVLNGTPGVDVTHTFSNANDGTILVGASLITYTGLEPIADNLDPANRVFTFNSANAAELITLSDYGTPDDGVSLIDSDDGESVAFTNPTVSLTINAGDGAQTMALGLLDTAAAVLPTITVVVNGDADEDIFNVVPVPAAAPGPGYTTYTLNGGAPTTCTGDIFNLASGTAPAGQTLASGTVTPAASGAILFTTMEVLGFASVDIQFSSATFDDNPVFPGDDITLTVTATNDAAAADQSQCVTIDLSALTSILNATSPPLPGAIVSAGTFDTGTFIWTIPTLDVGASETLAITFVVDTQLAGAFDWTVTASSGNTEANAGDNSAIVALTVDQPFVFPAKAHAQSAVFKTLGSGLERMVLGLYGGSPGVEGAVWCRVPEPDTVVFTVVGLGTVYKTCSEGLPAVNGTFLPLYVNDLWQDETGLSAGRIYMTTWGSQGLYYSDDDGESWTAIEPNLGDGFGGAAGWVNVYAITEDATDGILYISANNGKVFRSLNNGTAWQEVSSLPEGPADTPWSLRSHTSTPGTLFAGTFGKGVYVSTDYGLSWDVLNGNITTVGPSNLVAEQAGYIFDLEMVETGGFDYLFAGTSRGIWRMDYAAAQEWAELDADQGMLTPSGVAPEVRSLEFGDMDNSGLDELYAVTRGFGVVQHLTPLAAAPVAGDLNGFALRGVEVTMLAISPSGTLFAGTNDGGFYEMEAGSIVVDGGTSTSSEFDPTEVPDGYVLDQNYPNPFNPQTIIRFALPETGKVRLVVVDMLGRSVRALVDGQISAGTHEVTFDAGQLPSGTYLYRLEAEGLAITRRLSLVK